VRLRTLIVTVLTLALLWWFLRHASLVDVWERARRASPGYLLLALSLIGTTYWTRARRWHHMLTPIGPTRFRSVFRATVIGFAALAVLPARAGDVLRPYLVARQEGLSVASTLATIVIERVLDLATVLFLLAVFVFGFADAGRISPRMLRSIELSAGLAASAAAALLVVLWVMGSHPERIGGVVLWAGRALPRRAARAVAAVANQFSSGLAVFTRPRHFLAAVLWSFPVWLGGALEVWAVTRAFGIEMAPPGSFLLQALLVIGVAVPTPGGVGSFHEAYRFGATTFFGAQNGSAVAAAIVLHALSFFPVAAAGLLFMAQDGLTLGRIRLLAQSQPGSASGERAASEP
jgi:hypothetical protein